MSELLDQFDRATSRVVTVAAYVAGFVLVALTVLTTLDVAARYFFNSPITGVFDLTHFAVLIMTFMGLSYCAYHGAHVSIELLFNRLGKGTQVVVARITNLAGAVLFLVIAWQSVVQSIDVRDFKEASQLLLIPLYPLYWVLALGAVMFAAVMLLRVFRPLEEKPQDDKERAAT